MLQEVSIWSQAFCDFDNTNKNKVTVTAGQHAGLKGYIAVPATYFPFERLPLELRQRIYKLLFPLRRTVSLDHVSHGINYTYYSQRLDGRSMSVPLGTTDGIMMTNLPQTCSLIAIAMGFGY